MTSFADRERMRINWGSFRQIDGAADGIGPALKRLLEVTTTDEAESAYWGLENWIVAQGVVYSAAEPAISVLMASFLDSPIHQIKISALDVIEQVLRGWPHPVEFEAGNGDLIARCRERVREGMWLLIREALLGPPVQGAALDVIELVDEARAAQVRGWLGDPPGSG